MEAAERRSLRCVWVTGGRALTEQEAAVEIVSEARLLLQEDLAQLGVQWDPTTLCPGAPVSNLNNHHSSNSDSSVSCPQEAKADGSKEGEGYMHNKREGRDTDAEEAKGEFKPEKPLALEEVKTLTGNSRGEQQEETQVNKKKEEQTRKDRIETEVAQTGSGAPVERGIITRTKKTNTTLSTANVTENPDEISERQKHTQPDQEIQECKNSEEKEGHESEGTVSVTIRGQQGKRPIPERSLTQELAEIVCSPPQLLPHPQPSFSPMPPPRFRAPISRVEESVSTKTSNGDGTTGLASPLQPGRLRHSRALSKVLLSIQTDKSLQNNVDTAQMTRPCSDPNSARAAEVPDSVQAPEPMPQRTPTVFAGTNNSPLSVSPVSVPLISPKAKRRRIEDAGLDQFSSPELYAGGERDEEVEGHLKKREESFGDSFELDTQTEKILLQHGNGNNRNVHPLVETEEIKVQEMAEMCIDTEERKNGFEAPDNACPRFNISLTDSQMELILNTSHQVTEKNNQSSWMEFKNEKLFVQENSSYGVCCCFYRFPQVLAVMKTWKEIHMKMVVMLMKPLKLIQCLLRVLTEVVVSCLTACMTALCWLV